MSKSETVQPRLSFPKVSLEWWLHLDKHLGRKREMGLRVCREGHMGL